MVFVDRENTESKANVLETLEKRINEIKKGKNFSPILLYPEGTRTNGNYLLDFKKGAFFTHCPIYIYCNKFNNCNIVFSNGAWPFFRLFNNLSVVKIGPFYPDHLNLNVNNPNDWKKYAEKVRDIMAKCLGVEKSDSSVSESIDYKKFIKNFNSSKTRENY